MVCLLIETIHNTRRVVSYQNAERMPLFGFSSTGHDEDLDDPNVYFSVCIIC